MHEEWWCEQEKHFRTRNKQKACLIHWEEWKYQMLLWFFACMFISWGGKTEIWEPPTWPRETKEMTSNSFEMRRCVFSFYYCCIELCLKRKTTTWSEAGEQSNHIIVWILWTGCRSVRIWDSQQQSREGLLLRFIHSINVHPSLQLIFGHKCFKLKSLGTQSTQGCSISSSSLSPNRLGWVSCHPWERSHTCADRCDV